MQGWQANENTHLWVASSIRAMPENEKPPAMRVDNYYIHSTSLKEVLYAMIIKVTTRNV